MPAGFWRRIPMPRRSTALLLAPLVLSVLGSITYANVRIPTDPPFYARIERDPAGHPVVLSDGEWAIIPFYRETSCVPADFNLLNLFDVPRAFGCTLAVDGFEVWEELPPPAGGAPIQAISHGLVTMEIWFVDWEELSAAMADDVLTVTELAALPSLVRGTPTVFKETLHPVGGANQPVLQMIGFGELEDGRSFRISAVGPDFSFRVVQIVIE
jgi:hypothetical protein